MVFRSLALILQSHAAAATVVEAPSTQDAVFELRDRYHVALAWEGDPLLGGCRLELSEPLVARTAADALVRACSPSGYSVVSHDGLVEVCRTPSQRLSLLDQVVSLPGGQRDLHAVAEELQAALVRTRGAPLKGVVFNDPSPVVVNVPPGPMTVRDLLLRLDVVPERMAFVPDEMRDAPPIDARPARVVWHVRDADGWRSMLLEVVRQPVTSEDSAFNLAYDAPPTDRLAQLESMLAYIRTQRPFESPDGNENMIDVLERQIDEEHARRAAQKK